MSQENVELLRRATEAFNRRYLVFVALTTPTVEQQLRAHKDAVDP
jgi:hypothetical protein